jgi:hypothetical protein
LEVVVGEIVLRINDDIVFDKVIALLAPYIAQAEIKKANGKIWTGKADWLDTPIKMESLTPLSREETHAR